METCFEYLYYFFDKSATTSFCLFLCGICMAAAIWKTLFSCLVNFASGRISERCLTLIERHALKVATKDADSKHQTGEQREHHIKAKAAAERESARLLVMPEFPDFKKKTTHQVHSIYCSFTLFSAFVIAILMRYEWIHCHVRHCVLLVLSPIFITLVMLMIQSIRFYSKQKERLTQGQKPGFTDGASTLHNHKHRKESFSMEDEDLFTGEDEEEETGEDGEANSEDSLHND